MLTREEVKEVIIERVDPDTFIDRMHITIEQLVEAFEEELDGNRGCFDDELSDDELFGDLWPDSDMEDTEAE